MPNARRIGADRPPPRPPSMSCSAPVPRPNERHARSASENPATRSRTAEGDSGDSATARTSREPMMTPSAPASAAAAAWSGVPIPKPSATGTDVHACARGQDRRERVAPGRPLAGRAGHGDRVEEAAGLRPDPREALVGARRRDERHQRETGRVARLEHRAGLLERQVGHDEPAGARVDRPLGEHLRSPREDEVRVAHEDDRDPGRDRLADPEHAAQRRARARARRCPPRG